ncbi:uncharacterized protein LOC100213655 [Hydra vulgaris]|uniref:uncharacterized protein LOC100213655 n=1 Tax=Hydra vulgaris TaxID=6087 RepID=UPI0001924597|nr:uncharacterized protein LOC100213655 [Hydra vulgaris]
MKIAVVFALFFVSFAYSAPVEEDDCLSLFSNEVCTTYSSLEKEIEVGYGYNGYQDVDILTIVLKKKLDFLIQERLLEKIPLVGDKLHDFVAKNQDLVASVLKKGVTALIQNLVPKLKSFLG